MLNRRHLLTVLLASATAPGGAFAGDESVIPRYVVHAQFCEMDQPLAPQEGSRQSVARAQELHELAERLRRSAEARKAPDVEVRQLRALEQEAAQLDARLRTDESEQAPQMLSIRADQLVVDHNADALILIRPDADTLKRFQQTGRTLNEPTVVALEGKEASVSVATQAAQVPYLQRTAPGQYELASAAVSEGFDMGVTVRNAGEEDLVRLALKLRCSRIVGRRKAEGMPEDLGNLGAPIVDVRDIQTELTLKLGDKAVLIFPASRSASVGRPAAGADHAALAAPDQPVTTVILTVKAGGDL